MSRQLDHSTVQTPTLPISKPKPHYPLFAFPPPDSPQIITSSGINSDTNSDITVFQTISQFEKFLLGNPRWICWLRTIPFHLFSSQSFYVFQTSLSTHPLSHPLYIPSTPSHVSQITPTYSLFISEHSTNNSPDTTQNSDELNKLKTLQQQLQYPHTLTIHQLSSTIT